MNLNKQKILITGAAGFIGSNLSEYFVSKGAYVIGLDNLSTGFKNNISSILNNDNFKFIEGDITDFETCEKACNNIDYVLHQAALGSVPRSIKDPIATNNSNVNGFLNMLVSSKSQKVKRFIYAASSSTYGDSKNLPKMEDIIGKPLSPYAITKYLNELYAQNFSSIYGIETVGLRYFNVYGRKQTPEGAYAAVIPKFIKKLINYESPEINGDGSFSRDFTYIDNIIQMNLLAMTTVNKKAINQIFNTACGQRTNLNELVNILKKYLSKYDKKISKIKPIYGPNREGDIPHSLASIDKAKKLLGYKPTHDIQLGIKESIDWYFKNLK